MSLSATNLANIHLPTNLTKFCNSRNFRNWRKVFVGSRWALQQFSVDKRITMNIPCSFNVLPEMKRAQQELRILGKSWLIFAVSINFVEEFNSLLFPGHISVYMEYGIARCFLSCVYFVVSSCSIKYSGLNRDLKQQWRRPDEGLSKSKGVTRE